MSRDPALQAAGDRDALRSELLLQTKHELDVTRAALERLTPLADQAFTVLLGSGVNRPNAVDYTEALIEARTILDGTAPSLVRRDE